MRQTRVTGPIPRPTVGGDRPSAPMISTMPLSTFRPRGSLAVAILLVPALFFLALICGIMIAGLRGQTEAVLLGVSSGMAIGWVVCVYLFSRIILMTVTANAEGLTTQYPWGGSQTVRWTLIDRADRQLGLLRIHSSEGKNLLILETGLAQGERLLRQLILSVSPTVLSLPLQRELSILGGDLFAIQSQATFPELTVAPYWLVAAGGLALAGCGLAAWGFASQAAWLLIVGALIGIIGALTLLLFRQRIILTEVGITITRGLGGPRTMTWFEMVLIEQLPLELAMGLRGAHRIVFLGPFFMSSMRRDLLRNALRTHLIDRGIPIYISWWIL